MGLYHEDKLLQPKANGTVLEKMLHDGYKEVESIFKTHGDSILLERDTVERWDTERISKKPAPPFAIPIEISVYTDELGAVNIRYSKYSPTRSGKIVTYPNNRILAGKNLVITKKDKDLAWYLLIATNFVERDGKNKDAGVFKIYNPKAELKEKAEEVQRIAGLDKYLSDKDSPVYNVGALTEIAGRLGIDIDITEGELDLAAYQIRESVVAGEKGRNPHLNIKSFNSVVAEVIDLIENSGVIIPTYTRDQLEDMAGAVINKLSRDLGTPHPPQCNRGVQIDKILEKQRETE